MIPSGQYKHEGREYAHEMLLVAFVEDFAALFDSTNAIAKHMTDGPCDLR